MQGDGSWVHSSEAVELAAFSCFPVEPSLKKADNSLSVQDYALSIISINYHGSKLLYD